MVEGHEYAETITDQNPAGGWTNTTSRTYSGQENADECAWIAPGSAGGAGNVSTTAGELRDAGDVVQRHQPVRPQPPHGGLTHRRRPPDGIRRRRTTKAPSRGSGAFVQPGEASQISATGAKR